MSSNKLVPSHLAKPRMNGGKTPAQAHAETLLKEFIKARQHQTVAIDLTPELARLFLDRRGIQRPVKGSHVDYLISQIRAGKWQYNGDTIRLSKSGHLIDGQHRCLAVVESGITIKTDLSIAVDDMAFYTINRGIAMRSSSDVLSIARGDIGCDPKTAVGAIRWVVSIDAAGDQQAPVKPRGRDVDDIAIVKSWDNHSEALRPAVQWAIHNRMAFRPPSLFAALYYVIHRARKRGATTFFEQLATGEDLHRGDPALVLRNKLHAIYTNDMQTTDPVMIAALVIFAWNAYVQERTIEKMAGVKRNGDGSLKFPQIRTTKFGYGTGAAETVEK